MSNWYASQKTIERKVGRPYLYCKIEDVKRNISSINTSAINGILKEQTATFYSRFNQTNKTSLGEGKIKEILRDWTSSGVIGQKIDQAMQNIAIDDSGDFKYGTSGGVLIGGTVPLSEAKTVFNTSKKKAMESCPAIVSAVNKSIDSILTVLAKNNEYILVEAIKNAYYGENSVVPKEAQSAIKGQKAIKKGLLNESDTKVVATVKSMSEAIASLEQLAKKSKSINAKTARSEYSRLIGIIQQCFNSIGGTVHELAIAHATNVAANIGDGAIKKTNRQIHNLVSAGNGRFYSQWDAQDKDINGKETKNDVTFTYNKDGLVVQLGGTVKLRQNQAFRGSGDGSQVLGVQGFVARGENYDSITKKLEKYSPGINQTGYQLLGAWGEDRKGVPGTDNIHGEWWSIKQLAGALTLVDSISGQGGPGDFASLLIVNNRIFSVADILERAMRDLPRQIMNSNEHRYFNVDLSYHSLLGKVQEQSKSNIHNRFMEALDRNRFTYSTLQNAKIKITVNLGNIYGKNAFK